MFYAETSWVPRCTIRRHRDGGFTPVLHPAHMRPPASAPTAISFPDVAHAAQYARDHYGTVLVVVAGECLLRAS